MDDAGALTRGAEDQELDVLKYWIRRLYLYVQEPPRDSDLFALQSIQRFNCL